MMDRTRLGDRLWMRDNLPIAPKTVSSGAARLPLPRRAEAHEARREHGVEAVEQARRARCGGRGVAGECAGAAGELGLGGARAA
jgi:hypothetical protein